MKYTLLLCLFLAGTTCAFSDTIYISPASLDVSDGQTFSVAIDVDNISNLALYQFTLNFNSTLLAFDSITEGALFADTDNSFPISTNGAGTVSLYDTLLSGSVDGPGTLAVIDFTAIATGTSPFTLSNVELYDPSYNRISVTTQSGAADVVTAEPATLSLLVLALGLMIFGKWRRSKRAAIVARHSNSQLTKQLKGGAEAFTF